MHIDIAGQVALVTGSAHRVGKAIALELAKNGVHIMVHYGSSSEETVKETLREIKSEGVDAFAVQADISTPDGVETVFAAIAEQFGRLNILVNSASNFQRRKLMEISYADWQETMAINLTGPFLCTQKAVLLMLQNDPPGGAIVNILDRGALEPWPNFAHHGISKAGLRALTEVTAASLGPEIRANGIIPGAVLKPEAQTQEQWDTNALETPMKRPGSAEDVARAVTYLVSEDWVTGAILKIDGGAFLV
jgi:pteridine reductase